MKLITFTNNLFRDGNFLTLMLLSAEHNNIPNNCLEIFLNENNYKHYLVYGENKLFNKIHQKFLLNTSLSENFLCPFSDDKIISLMYNKLKIITENKNIIFLDTDCIINSNYESILNYAKLDFFMPNYGHIDHHFPIKIGNKIIMNYYNSGIVFSKSRKEKYLEFFEKNIIKLIKISEKINQTSWFVEEIVCNIIYNELLISNQKSHNKDFEKNKIIHHYCQSDYKLKHQFVQEEINKIKESMPRYKNYIVPENNVGRNDWIN